MTNGNYDISTSIRQMDFEDSEAVKFNNDIEKVYNTNPDYNYRDDVNIESGNSEQVQTPEPGANNSSKPKLNFNPESPEVTKAAKGVSVTPKIDNAPITSRRAKSEAKLWDASLENFTSMICGAISGMPATEFKRTKEERADYVEITTHYIETNGSIMSPQTIFYMTTGGIILTKGFKTYNAKKQNAINAKTVLALNKSKKVEQVNTPAPSTESVTASNEKVSTGIDYSGTKEFLERRTKYAVAKKTGKYKYSGSTYLSNDEQVEYPSQEILPLINQGLSDPQIRQIIGL